MSFKDYIKESHFKKGDTVKCKKSGMIGTVVNVDPKEKGKYYTVEIDKGEEGSVKVKYSPDELEKVDDNEITDDMDSMSDMETMDEARSSNIMGLVSEIKKIPSVEKLVDLWSQSDGMAALYRTKDGNAYEITIRPAAYAAHSDIQQKTKGKK